MVVVNWDNYKDAIKVISGTPYVTVAGQLRAAHESGLLVSISTELQDTETHLRIKATATILNREFVGVDLSHLPEETIDKLVLQTYDGWAEWLKTGATGPGKRPNSPDNVFPIETLETSVVGRALTKAGYSIMTSATADEMENIDKKQEVGNGYSESNEVSSPRDAVAKKLRSEGYTTQKKVNELTQEVFKKDYPNLTGAELATLERHLAQPKGAAF